MTSLVILAALEAKRQPLLIMEHGRPAAVMLDVESYEALLSRMDLLERIARGERAMTCPRQAAPVTPSATRPAASS